MEKSQSQSFRIQITMRFDKALLLASSNESPVSIRFGFFMIASLLATLMADLKSDKHPYMFRVCLLYK